MLVDCRDGIRREPFPFAVSLGIGLWLSRNARTVAHAVQHRHCGYAVVLVGAWIPVIFIIVFFALRIERGAGIRRQFCDAGLL